MFLEAYIIFLSYCTCVAEQSKAISICNLCVSVLLLINLTVKIYVRFLDFQKAFDRRNVKLVVDPCR